MPIGRRRKGKGDKLEPTDNYKQSDTNKLPDESDTDHTVFSDCSSEDGSLNRQSLNDADSSVDSGHDSDCMSKPSTLSDVTSSEFSSVNDSTSDSNDSEHPLTSLSSNDSNYVSIASDFSSSHSSPKSDSVARKGAEYLRTYDTEKTKSSFSTDTYADKVQHESLDRKVQRYSDKMESAERHAIPRAPHHFYKKELRNIKRKKQFTTHISKDLLRNTDYTDDSDYTDAIKRMPLIAEKLKQYPVKYLVKEAVDELMKLVATGNAADSIAAIKNCLGYLKDELAAGRLTDDHLANYLVKKLPELVLLTIKSTTLEKEINNSVYGKEEMKDDSRLAPVELDVVSDVNGHQSSDDQYLEYLCDSMGKAEKDYSILKAIKDCKYFQNQVYRQEDVVVMFSSDGNGDQGDQADNQGNQVDYQGNGTNIPADIPGQAAQGNPQAVELPENIDTSNQQQGQEYSPMLAIQEEGTRGAQEKVFEVPKPFELPEKSELVTLFSHPFHTVYHVEDQPVTSEYQRFSKILASKGVTIEMMVGLVHTSAACVEYHISEVLHSISVIIDDAGLVFLAENVCKWLPAVVEQALIMMHMNERPIPVTESEADIPFATSVTSNSHVPNRPHNESLRYFPPEALCTSSRDQSMAPVDGVNNFQVTTNPLQDTDNGVGDVNVVDIGMYEIHHSAEACNVIEIEDFQLRDYCCCICGTSTCQGERIVEEIRTLLLRNARCCICIEEITNLVNFNTRQNCIPGMLRTHVPQETMQRNVALGCPAFVTRCQMFDASHIFKPVAQCSINSFINLQCRTLFSNVYGHLSNTTAMITSEGPISFVNVQNLSDRLCGEFNSLLSNQSILQLFTRQATSEYLSSCHEHIQTFLSNLPHGILQNASSKLSISMTVMPDGVPIDMDQLKNGLLSSRVALRCRDSITSSLHLPPINAFNNIPIIVNWTVTIQSSLSCLQVGLDGVESIDPVEAVNLHGRESLVAALQPTYSHHGDEEGSNPVQPINNLVENPIFDPNDDGHKTNRADIYEFFPEDNSLYENQPSDNDTIVNDNQINCEPEEATISDVSSKPESKI